MLTIGELAEAGGVSVRALRYYEEQGLLVSERTAGNQRRYAPGAVDQVLLIQQLFAAGISGREVLDFLPCMHTGRATPAMIERLTVARSRLDEQIGGLTSTRRRLDSVLESALARAG